MRGVEDFSFCILYLLWSSYTEILFLGLWRDDGKKQEAQQQQHSITHMMIPIVIFILHEESPQMTHRIFVFRKHKPQLKISFPSLNHTTIIQLETI